MHAGLSTALLPLHLLLLNLKPVQLTCAAELCKSDFKLSLHSGAEGEEPTTGGRAGRREEVGGGEYGRGWKSGNQTKEMKEGVLLALF